MMKLRQMGSVLDALYAPEVDDERWLTGICTAAEAAFDGHIGTLGMTARFARGGGLEFGHFVAEREERLAGFLACLQVAPAELAARDMFLSGPFVRVSSIFRDPAYADARRVFASFDAGDAVGAVATDPSGEVCALTFTVPSDASIPRTTRTALTRIAGHLMSARRLRGKPDERVDAVLDPDGTLLDVREDRIADESGASLREAALAVDRARRDDGVDPELALASWKAMVEGRWTLVERFESDGRRILVARENEPATRGLRSLDPSERKVVALCAVGRPSKVIAYDLGMSEGTVSRTLSRALEKLNLRTRAELVELHGALVGAVDRGEG